MASKGTQSESYFWLIDSGASFHMTPHRERFYEYERYNENVFLGDDLPKKIIGHGRVKLFLNDGRIKTLPGVLHILGLAINLTSINKMGDASVQTIFEKDRGKMVRGAMLFLNGVQCGTLYKLLGITVIDGCNNTIVPESKVEESNVPVCYGIKDWDILGRRVFNHYKVKVWLKVC